jgi:hypothetical protein
VVVLGQQQSSLELAAIVTRSLERLSVVVVVLIQLRARVLELYVLVQWVGRYMTATRWRAHRLALPRQLPAVLDLAPWVSVPERMISGSKHGSPWFGALLAAGCAGCDRESGLFVLFVHCQTTMQLIYVVPIIRRMKEKRV